MRPVIGFDYWQVLSHFPEQFQALFDDLMDANTEVHIISAVGKERAGTVKAALEKLGYYYGQVHEVVFDHPSQSPELKLAKCKELGITMFFDDRDDVCRLLNKHGILACRVTRKDNSTYDLGAEQGEKS